MPQKYDKNLNATGGHKVSKDRVAEIKAAKDDVRSAKEQAAAEKEEARAAAKAKTAPKAAKAKTAP